MSHSMKIDEFLQHSHLFQLGQLVTEARHPETRSLSAWAVEDIEKAVGALVKVDTQALAEFKNKKAELSDFRQAVQEALSEGAKIYLCGCGATGRLSLLIESIWRELNPMSEQVQAFMAGGDTAIVHSLEGFEDFPEYGARHLKEMGFTENDLLISCTEGGETPYVIGATEEAAKLSKRAPYFLYCNPDHVLTDLVERSKAIIENSKINKLNLSVGPMGLSGSTRMQASTVLQLAVGFALFSELNESRFSKELTEIVEILEGNADLFLPGFIERESKAYADGVYIFYELQDHYITVFTDTTERAPTFSLSSFSSSAVPKELRPEPSLCHICIKGTESREEAWLRLLRRKPRALNWVDIESRTSDEYTLGFDFSESAREYRKDHLNGAEEEIFYISCSDGNFQWQFLDHEMALDVREGLHPLLRHTLLKMLLNIHSTVVMGRIGRFESNVMTYVYPTNGKLVDRATRYVQAILEDQGIKPSYDEVARQLLTEFEKTQPSESVVLKTVTAFTQ